MANPSHPSTRLVFGSFEFDPASGDLDKQGTPIRLAKQPSQILLALLRRHGDVVSRDELRQQLWRDEAFGDFEHGLNAAINKLRQTLGDSADQPRYIETLPGRGYRFIAPVQHVMPAVKTPAALRKIADRAEYWKAAKRAVTASSKAHWAASSRRPGQRWNPSPQAASTPWPVRTAALRLSPCAI